LRKQKKKQNERLVRSTLAASVAATVKADGESSGSEEELTVECVNFPAAFSFVRAQSSPPETSCLCLSPVNSTLFSLPLSPAIAQFGSHCLRCRYVASAAGINQSDPNYEHWKGVFEHFLPKEEAPQLDTDAVDRMLASASNVPLPPSAPEEKSLSKRRKKLMSRLRCGSAVIVFAAPRAHRAPQRRRAQAAR
jgi:hypothetical protein